MTSGSRERMSQPEATGREIGIRFATGLLVGLVAAFAALAIALNATGASSCWRPSPERSLEPVVVNDAGALLDAWSAAGVKNSVLVDFSNRFGFQTIPFGVQVTVPNRYPFDRFDLADAYRSQVTTDNVMWTAAHLGMFRTIHYVLTPDQMRQRIETGRAIGAVGIAADGRTITPNNGGYLRHVSADVPALDEPVVLNVDASYFEDGDPARLVETIRRSGLDVREFTINRSVDDTATSDAARRRLDEFVRLAEAAR